MIRTSSGHSRYTAADEYDVMVGRASSFSGAEKRGIVFCHGSGETGRSMIDKAETRKLAFKLAAHGTLISADLGYQTWGNDLGITRVGEAIAQLRVYGVTGKVALVGGSMGNATAMAYTKAHPSDICVIASAIPLISIPDIMAKGAAAEVNAAYGGTYDDVVNGPTHSPIQMATTLDNTIPVLLCATPDDPLVPYSLAEAWCAARATNYKFVTLPPGTGGHSLATINAAIPDIVSFVKYFLDAEHA